MPASKKIKKPWAIKGWLGLLYAQDFLSFAPSPQNPLPIRCGPPWTIECGRGHRWPLTRPSRPVQRWIGHGPRRPLPLGALRSYFFIRPPQRRRCAPICAPIVAPSPQPAPRHLCLHIFCNLALRYYSLRSAVGGAPSFIFSPPFAKAAQTKALPKRRSPIVRASDNLQSSPVCS